MCRIRRMICSYSLNLLCININEHDFILLPNEIRLDITKENTATYSPLDYNTTFKYDSSENELIKTLSKLPDDKVYFLPTKNH